MLKEMRTIAFAFFIVAAASMLCAAQSGGETRTPDFKRATNPTKVKEGQRFAVSLYQFNIQYVLENNQAKNRIVRESFEPLLDIYLRHPQWGFDLGLDAMFLEFISAYHPSALAKLRKLVSRGQAELVVFGYAHTLALAYPRHDQDWNSIFADEILKKLKFERSAVVAAYEGQFSAGMLDMMNGKGFFIALAPASALQSIYKSKQLAPMYRAGTGVVLPAGAEFRRADFSVTWNYYGFGEAALTSAKSPSETSFSFNAETSAKHENKLASLEKAGAIICRISDYVKLARTTNYAPPDLPPTPDLTWGGAHTENFFLWMGWYMSPVERDIEILSETYAARNELVLAETMLYNAKKQGADTAAEESLLRDAWHAELIAQSTSCTGRRPTSDEIGTCLQLAGRARETAVNIIRSLKTKLDMPVVYIDSYNGELSTAQPENETPGEIVPCPLQPKITGAAQSWDITCRRISNAETDMAVTLTPARWGLSLVSVEFPLLGDRLEFSPGLMELSLADIALSSFAATSFVLPLSNGLVGLGDGLTFIVSNNSQSHLAAHVDAAQRNISFRIKNAASGKFVLRFTIVSGDAEAALRTANRTNTFPHGMR